MLILINSKYKFSFYKNLCSVNTLMTSININDLIEIIKFGYLKNEIEKLRSTQNKEVYRKIKVSALPAVTVSGIFSQRNNKCVKKHSGLIQIDIDRLKNYEEVLTKILSDNYTYVAFKSPGGKGIKVIVKINPDVSTHLEQFYALEAYYKKEFNIEIDPSCKDIARCLLLSYDPNIFCNPFSDVFEECFILEKKEVKKDFLSYSKVNLTNGRNNKQYIIEQLIKIIEKEGIDITDSYENWIKVGYAISDALGALGRIYFHRISQFHPNYNQHKCDKQFTSIHKRNNGSISLGTLIFIAKQKGIIVKFNNENNQSIDNVNPFSVKDKNLYDRLKTFRQIVSQKKQISQYYIYNNATIKELVRIKPQNIAELVKIKGIGKKKIESFGAELLKEFQDE